MLPCILCIGMALCTTLAKMGRSKLTCAAIAHLGMWHLGRQVFR